MKTEDGNKLIAEFMGSKFINEPYKNKDGEMLDYWHWSKPNCNYPKSIGIGELSTAWQIGNFHFHDSWDWLMIVVEKIGKTIIPKDWLNAGWDLNIHYCLTTVGTSFEIGDHDLHITDSGIEAKEWLNTSKDPLTRTWLAVIEFIKWYNEQKNK